MADNNGVEFVAGFLLGAVAGAAMGLLFAPQSGEETRQQIKEQSIELKGKAEEMGARGKIVLDERVAALEEAVAEGKKSADKTRTDLMAKLDQSRSAPPPAAAGDAAKA